MSNNNGAKRQKIFIGIPCYREIDGQYLEDMMRFAYHCGRRMPQYDFFLGIKTKSEQFRARNAIVDGAQQVLADWLLMLDDDMIVDIEGSDSATDAYSFIERLISHQKDICGILYFQRGGECAPVVFKKSGENGYRPIDDDEIEHGLQRADVAGGGCLLINMKVFDKLKFPYFEPEITWGTDIQLCRQAIEKGFEVWVDTSIELGHLRTEKIIITSKNRHQFKIGDVNSGVRNSFVTADLFTELIKDGLEFTGYKDFEQMVHVSSRFLQGRKTSGLDDADWYREHGNERIARQIVFNSQNRDKRIMTEHILGSIDHHRSQKILDFGCGIGIPAFSLAQKGHNVTAMDIRGTGTFEFLKWRARRHGVPITFVDSEGGAPNLTDEYDVIIAMDSIEHIEEWKWTVQKLGLHLRSKGALFSNNGILQDKLHPEHYPIDNAEFIKTCIDSQLMPHNPITYVKKEMSNAQNAHSFA